MSDFDGLDAFNNVIERLVEMSATMRESNARFSDVVNERDEAMRRANRAEHSLAELQARQSLTQPLFDKLWIAANTMRQPLPIGVMGQDSEEQRRNNLKEAVENASPYCDEIPF